MGGFPDSVLSLILLLNNGVALHIDYNYQYQCAVSKRSAHLRCVFVCDVRILSLDLLRLTSALLVVLTSVFVQPHPSSASTTRLPV